MVAMLVLGFCLLSAIASAHSPSHFHNAKNSHSIDEASWEHSWDTALAGQFIDYGYQTLTGDQAQFVATHYSIVSLEKCTGPGPTEPNVWATAQQLKSINPAIKVLFYWDLDQAALSCYNAYHEYMASPQFWLKDDQGAVVYNGDSPPVPRMDYTVKAARDWWINVPLNGTTTRRDDRGNEQPAQWIDGILADGTGSRCPSPKISKQRCDTIISAKSAMIQELQALFTTANNGRVIGNGIDMYDGGPRDRNIYSLQDMSGIIGEHFAVFESVNANNNTLNTALVAEFLDILSDAAINHPNKTIVIATWPGLCTSPFNKDGYPSWPGNTQPTTVDGWRAAMLAKHTFALAGYLTIAGPNVFMQYQGWYNGLTQGAIACPTDPSYCSAPNPWYPDLSRPLGPPKGPAVRSGNVWRREFLHATSVLDLDHPDASQVTFQ